MRMPWIYRMAWMIFLLALPLFLYVGFRLSSALAKATENSRLKITKKTARLIVFLFILWFYIWPGILSYHRLTGMAADMFVFKNQLQWQDYLFIFPAWWGLIAVIEMFPYFLVLDIFGGIGRFTHHRRRKKDKNLERCNSPRWMAVVKIGIAAFFLIYVGIRTYIDTHHIHISHSRLTIEHLPPELEGLKLTLFGDIHISRYTNGVGLDKLRNTLQSGEDDLIFFTGDLTSRGFDFLEQAFDITGQPKAKAGSFACMGDHDYWTAANQIAKRMTANGWHFLRDRHQLVHYRGKRILITGLTYVYSKRIAENELTQLLSNAPAADLKIMYVHQPREHLVEIAADFGYHIFLGGHTHGGEVVNHIFGLPVSPSLKETRYAWGIHRFKDLQVVITNGIGRTLAALRYHSPAEITKLTLTNR